MISSDELSPLSRALKEDSMRLKGEHALRGNTKAAQVIAEIVSSSLGPNGMDKMLMETMGNTLDVVVTSDGATMLNRMSIRLGTYPGARITLEMSKAIEQEVGDGALTAVIIMAELLRRAEVLVQKRIHPTIIANGFEEAAEKAIEVFNNIAIRISPIDRSTLMKVARTAITSKTTDECDFLAELCLEAISRVMHKVDGKYLVNLDDVLLWKQPGGAISDSVFADGIILDKQPVHPEMPRSVRDAKIALLNCGLEVEKTSSRLETKIEIENLEAAKKLMLEEKNMLSIGVDKMNSLGVKVAVFHKGINDVAQKFLAQRGILAMRRARDSEMEALAKATGARVISYLGDLKEEDLGWADLVEERKVGDKKWTFIEGCRNPGAVTIMVRGGIGMVTDEAERVIRKGLWALRESILNPKLVCGGGASEVEVAKRLKRWAMGVGGRESLAAIEFAEALESIALVLSRNAGLNSIDTIVELRSAHDSGRIWAGVNSIQGRISDMRTLGIFEPLSVKAQVVKSATETACLIIRVDDIVAIGKKGD